MADVGGLLGLADGVQQRGCGRREEGNSRGGRGARDSSDAAAAGCLEAQLHLSVNAEEELEAGVLVRLLVSARDGLKHGGPLLVSEAQAGAWLRRAILLLGVPALDRTGAADARDGGGEVPHPQPPVRRRVPQRRVLPDIKTRKPQRMIRAVPLVPTR